MSLPRLRLRDQVAGLLDLPWEIPLAKWEDTDHHFRVLPVGPSRHLVRFLVHSGTVYALKELPDEPAEREFDVLRHLEDAHLPGVRAVGLAVRPKRHDAILVTEYLRHSMQYRRLLMRFRGVVSSAYRDRLLDAMALLLVDLHRGGVYWGDCSLANTLFRRDGDRIQAYLVDAETSEIHPALTDGQRAYDLDILVENVAFGLADLAAYLGRSEEMESSIEAAESVRARYTTVWSELHDQPELMPGDRQAIRARLRRLNDLGFSVDLALDPAGKGKVQLRTSVTTRRHHANELERRTRLRALEGQARLLLNDLAEYGAWLEHAEGRRIEPDEQADRWLREVYRPTQARIAREVGRDRDLVQAYCDVLEHKWLRSEAAGHDVGLEAAINSYLAEGAPAPEVVVSPSGRILDPLAGLDVEELMGLAEDEGTPS